ncbi:hypothetical protein Hanom_Chr04g00355751 [Helianthus anomalus]
MVSPAEDDQSPVGGTVHEEVREVGGEEPSPADFVDTCMGSPKGNNDREDSEVGQGGNFEEQSNSLSGKSLYRFSSVGPSKVRRRPKSSLSHRPKNKAHLSPSSPVEEPRPKKRGRTEDGDPFDIDRFIGNLEIPFSLSATCGRWSSR